MHMKYEKVHAETRKACQRLACQLPRLEPSDASNPLFGLPNVIVSPHNAASTEEGLARMARQAAQNILDVLDGRRDPAFMVNPEIANL